MEDKILVDILGLQSTPGAPGAFALILKERDGGRRLPIVIGQFEAQSIALELEKVKPSRPLTHDLVKNILDSLGFSVLEVVINELREGTFHARLIIDSQEIDSRPSDAIAIAVRYGVPIYVSEEVMDEASYIAEEEPQGAKPTAEESEIEPEEEDESDTPLPPKQSEKPQKLTRRQILQKRLEEAISKEEYEKAAKLRDELRKLTGEQ